MREAWWQICNQETEFILMQDLTDQNQYCIKHHIEYKFEIDRYIDIRALYLYLASLQQTQCYWKIIFDGKKWELEPKKPLFRLLFTYICLLFS